MYNNTQVGKVKYTEMRSYMFEVNEKVVYGVVGVCEIEQIGRPPIKGIDKDYYFLQPVYDTKGIIYSPVENNKVMIRSIIGKDTCIKLIDRAKNCSEWPHRPHLGRRPGHRRRCGPCILRGRLPGGGVLPHQRRGGGSAGKRAAGRAGRPV